MENLGTGNSRVIAEMSFATWTSSSYRRYSVCGLNHRYYLPPHLTYASSIDMIPNNTIHIVIYKSSRPWTFTFGLSTSLVGTILAYHTIQQFDMINFIAGLAIGFTTLFIANLSNSYCDRKNGVDTAEEANDRAILPFDVFQMALVPYIMVLLVSVGYTAGPFPLKYHALGEIYPILLNGGLVIGAYISQCQSFNVNILIYYIPFCLVGMGPMHTNNVRDIIPDTKAGITTIPMLFGHKWSCYNHCGAFILHVSTSHHSNNINVID
eukprot:gene17166-20445_t